MEGPKAKGSFGRLRRSALLVGVAGTAAAALVAGAATAAQADTPTQVQGALVLAIPSGSTSVAGLAWSTTIGCPSGFQGSAVLFSLDSSSSPVDSLSPTNTSGLGAAGISGNIQFPMSAVAGDLTNNPFEIALACYTSTTGTGPFELVQTTTVTISPDGSTYTSGAAAAAASTSVSLATVPAGVTSVNSGSSVTFEATVSASDSTHPAGSVQFAVNGSTSGIAPVSVAAGATTADFTTSFSVTSPTTENVTAVFTPTNTTSYNTSPASNTVSVTVQPTGAITATNSPIAVSVTVGATGTFAVTVEPPASVALTGGPSTFTGTMPTVQVDDTRNSTPGWSVSGQESTFTSSGSATISASQLGWAPAAVTSPVSGVTVDGPVAPGTVPGLAAVTELAHAVAGGGFGAGQQFNAMLTLDVPGTTPPGTYTGQLSITAVQSAP